MRVEHPSEKLSELGGLRQWLDDQEIEVAANRLGRYIKLYERYSAVRKVSELSHEEYDEFIFVVREVDELLWVWKGIRRMPAVGVQGKLQEVLGGAPISRDDSQQSKARNSLVELRTASYFMQYGLPVDVSGDADVVVDLGNRGVLFCECKRPLSRKKVHDNLKKAVKQLERRFAGAGRPSYGIVVLDVGRIVNPHQGLSVGVDAASLRNRYRYLLKVFAEEFDLAGEARKSKRILSVWLQLAVPALLLSEAVAATQFSSLHEILIDPASRQKRAKVFRQLATAWESAGEDAGR